LTCAPQPRSVGVHRQATHKRAALCRVVRARLAAATGARARTDTHACGVSRTCTCASLHSRLTVRCTCSATSRVGSTTSACGRSTSAWTPHTATMPNVTVFPVPDLACARREVRR
jgi:hypothetical protein